MKPGKWMWIGLAVIALFAGAGFSQDAKDTQSESRPAPEEVVSDLVVTLRHVGGTEEVFKDEIVRMELVLDIAGRLDQVHLVTRTGTEADTHIWYNMNNLVSVRYQFLAITGKAKVTVRALSTPKALETVDSPRDRVAPLKPDDYR